MFAVIELGGSQFFVKENDTLNVNRLEDNKEKSFKCETVLFAKKGSSFSVGSPYVKGAYVECEILGNKRLKKIIAYKYTPRKSSQTKRGHRQEVTELRVKDIHLGEETNGA